MDANTRITSALVAAITVAASLLSLAPDSLAANGIERDHEGRAINLNVEVPGVDATGIAQILADAPHGNEISDVTVTVAHASRISSRCGSFAEACFVWGHGDGGDRNEIFIPPWSPDQVKQVLLHEYAHHLDASSVVARGAKVFDGTPRWFAARNMSGLTGAGRVGWMYGHGWDRSIGEIFAEDYVVLSLGDDARHRIHWLGAPSRRVLAAMAADLGGTVSGIRGALATPDTRPVRTTNSSAASSKKRRISGLVRRNGSRRVPVAVKNTRRVTVVGALRGSKKGRTVVRLRCGSRTVGTVRRTSRGRFRLRGKVSGGRCALIVSAKRAPVRYTMVVRST